MAALFVDEDLDPVEFKSTWKKIRSLTESETQTRDLETQEVAVQSIKRKHIEVQTDDYIEENIELWEDDSPELLDFVRRVVPFMENQLSANARSHAFDDYRVRWADEVKAVENTHTLRYQAFAEQLYVTGLAWNCTGSVIAAAYGRLDHEDWCTHKAGLCTWNLDRKGLDVNKPDTVIDLPCCLTAIAGHPKKPSWIAGGTFNGEVIVWDTGREDDSLIYSSKIGDDSHREPVSKVHWVLDQESKGKQYQVVSSSSDGKVLVWRLASKQRLKLTDGFVLMTESLPRELRVKARRGDLEMGVTCICFKPDDETTFLIGSESGGIFKCSTNAKGTPASRDVVCSVPLRSAVTFTFTPHHGPVYSVEFSPHHRNVFLSCGTDNSIRLYSLLQAAPLMTVEPSAGYLYSVKWSPVRPLVITVATQQGCLLVYDLKQNRAVPVLKLQASPKKLPVYTMQFNPQQQQLLATGEEAGHIQIWQMSREFTEEATRELEILEEIAHVAVE